MKSRWHIGLAFILLTACTKPGTPPPEEDMLYRVECFYQKKPDSAKQILDTLNLAVLSDKEQAHYCLLRAKVNDIISPLNPENDSLMQVAENHFVGGKDKYFEALTFFTMAQQHIMKNGSNQTVLDYRLKALQSIEQCQHVDERLVRYSPTPTSEQNEIGRIENAIRFRLGMTYAANHYYRESIAQLKLAEDYYAKNQRHNLRTNAAFMLGNSYIGIQEYDSSLLYFERGRASAEAMHNIEEEAYYHNCVMLCNLCRAEDTASIGHSESQHLLHSAIAEGQKGLQLLENVESRLATGYRYEIFDHLSLCHFKLQQYDSSILYGNQALAINNKGDQTLLYKRLYNAHKALGDDAQAAHFAELVVNREPPGLEESQSVAEVKEEYEKQLEINRLESEHQLKRYRLYSWIALLLSVIMAMLWMVFRYHKNKEIEALQLREEGLRLQSDNERIAHEVRRDRLRRVHKTYTDGKSDAYQRILAEFDATYPKARRNVMEAYPTLNEQEYGLCVLGFLAFRAKEAALLMGFSEHTINHYRTNIRKKTGVGDLKSLIKGHLE